MVKAIKGLIETLKEGNDRDRDTLLQARQQDEEDLKICINLAVDYGATKDTNEFLMATEMFAKKKITGHYLFLL
jgi:predicted kinase